jgi:hypothetical protein
MPSSKVGAACVQLLSPPASTPAWNFTLQIGAPPRDDVP